MRSLISSLLLTSALAPNPSTRKTFTPENITKGHQARIYCGDPVVICKDDQVSCHGGSSCYLFKSGDIELDETLTQLSTLGSLKHYNVAYPDDAFMFDVAFCSYALDTNHEFLNEKSLSIGQKLRINNFSLGSSSCTDYSKLRQLFNDGKSCLLYKQMELGWFEQFGFLVKKVDHTVPHMNIVDKQLVLDHENEYSFLLTPLEDDHIYIRNLLTLKDLFSFFSLNYDPINESLELNAAVKVVSHFVALGLLTIPDSNFNNMKFHLINYSMRQLWVFFDNYIQIFDSKDNEFVDYQRVADDVVNALWPPSDNKPVHFTLELHEFNGRSPINFTPNFFRYINLFHYLPNKKSIELSDLYQSKIALFKRVLNIKHGNYNLTECATLDLLELDEETLSVHIVNGLLDLLAIYSKNCKDSDEFPYNIDSFFDWAFSIDHPKNVNKKLQVFYQQYQDTIDR